MTSLPSQISNSASPNRKPGPLGHVLRQSSVPLEKVVIKALPQNRRVRQRINAGRFVREFYFDPERAKMAAPGDRPLNVAEFLNSADGIQQLGLTVTSADPNLLTVSVVELQKKQVVVRCLDDSQNPLKVASIEPAQSRPSCPRTRRSGP